MSPKDHEARREGPGGHRWTLAPFLALTLQRPRDHHEGGMETTLLWAAFSLGAWPWPEVGGLGTQGRKGKRLEAPWRGG